MRKFRIDFTQDNPCVDGCCLGRIGEHNATELIITPPAEITENKAATSYVIAFVTGGELIHSEPFNKAETLSVPLWKQLTMNPVLGIQLEAYDDAGEYIGKSMMVSGLRFLPSASGKDISADTDNPDFVSEILKTRHTHPNKDVLDSFGINNADTRPTFKGEVLATQYDVASRVAEHRAEVNKALEEVGGFTVNSMFLEAMTGVDIFDGYGNDIIGLMYPAADGAMPCGNDAVILDVGIVLQDGGEIRASQFPQSANFGADAVHHIFHMPQLDNEFGTYVLFRIVKDNYQGNELCGKLLTGEYSGVKIYYLGGN
ncbi:MAG: hypothetical protein IJD49_04155 [Clostridia bacterium]|nr:hypothetical protein [Clostridia bacterium]